MIKVSPLARAFNCLCPGYTDIMTKALHKRAFQGGSKPDPWGDMRALLRRGAEINKPAPDGGTVLNTICGQDLPILAKHLIEEAGADVNQVNANGTTPLMMACWAANPATVALLLEHGAKPTAKNYKGYDPFHHLLREGKRDVSGTRQKECLELLLKAGVQPTADDLVYIYHRRPEAALAIPDLAKARELETQAGENMAWERVEKLIQSGVNPDAPAQFGGDTPMYYAAQQGNAAAIRMLKKAGADPNLASGGKAWLPLQVAVQMGKSDAVAALLDAGADPLLKTGNNKSIIDYARVSADKGMEDYLTGLLAPMAQLPEPEVTTGAAVTTMPKLRLKTAAARPA